MTEKLKEFYELVSSKPELRERMDKLGGLGKEEAVAAVIELASEQGVVLTPADFGVGEGELDDDELNAVAGGDYCQCFSGGTGMGTGANVHNCSCPQNGLGELFRENEDGTISSSVRCWCGSLGNGTDDGSLFPSNWRPMW